MMMIILYLRAAEAVLPSMRVFRVRKATAKLTASIVVSTPSSLAPLARCISSDNKHLHTKPTPDRLEPRLTPTSTVQ